VSSLRDPRWWRTAPLLLWLLLSGCAVRAPFAGGSGRWIRAAWQQGPPRPCVAVPIYWYAESRCPLLYSYEIEVPAEAHSASALLSSAAHVYVYVDGRQVYAWPPPQAPNSASPPSDPMRTHAVDLGRELAPGPHVLTVSASADGFALEGRFYDRRGRRLGRVISDRHWRTARYAPTTVMEPEGRLELPLEELTVTAGEPWSVAAGAVDDIEHDFRVERLHDAAAEAEWRIALFVERGIYEVGGVAHGGLGFRRDPGELAAVAALAKRLEEGDDPNEVLADLRAATRRAQLRDERKALRLIAAEVDGGEPGEAPADAPAARAERQRLEARLDHPTNALNRSRYDRLGWAPIAGLLDNDPAAWGVGFGGVSGPSRLPAVESWRYAADPGDVGIDERRWARDYNLDNIWEEVAATSGDAGADRPSTRPAGIAWYRAGAFVPRSWEGRSAQLALPVDGAVRLWWDGNEIAATDEGGGGKHYRIALPVGAAAESHLIALRVVVPAGGGAPPGRGEWTATASAGSLPPVAVAMSPLSPAVRIEPSSSEVHIEHDGRLRVGIWDGAAVVWRDDYRLRRDGRLRTNWLLLRGAAVAPILFVFQRNPVSVLTDDGTTRIGLASDGEHVVAVRPFGDQTPGTWDETTVAGPLKLWSGAARALPTDYVSVTRVLAPGGAWRQLSVDRLPRGPLLGQSVIYEYAIDGDEWATKPLRLAPLPAFASYALDRHYPGLEADVVTVVQPAGMLAPYRAVVAADRVRYRYPVEPFPRFAGFTSWMFEHGDAGVPGNAREMALLAAIGANSFRAQHNWSDEEPILRVFPEDRRPRIEVLLDACRAAGLTYINNIDQCLGLTREEVRADYERLGSRLMAHYGKLLRWLAPPPFADVAYDLINEPFDHPPARYNTTIAALTRLIRQRDRKHLLYVEPPQSWGGVGQMPLIEPTGDPLTAYSFHDYEFRLTRATDRWPTLQVDLASIYRRWLPAFRFQIEHGAPLHCGEFGGFAAESHASPSQRVLLNDLLQVLDQFGMHHHYYPGRAVYLTQADGSLLPSEVTLAYRDYFRDGAFNRYYR